MILEDRPSTHEVTQHCFDLYIRSSDQKTKTDLFKIIRLSESLGESLIDEEIDISTSQYDTISVNIGGVILNELSEIEQLEDDQITPERQRLIDSFDKGIEAFFPEGVSILHKTQLFELADRAYQRPNGKSDENTETYNYRRKLIYELLGKNYSSDKFYHGISIIDLFETADWLYGGDEDQYSEQGWSIDPRLPYQLNPLLLRYDKKTIQSTASGLSEIVGIPVPTILTSAARGAYRYLQSPALIQDEIEKMKELGLDKVAIKRRPDILNYPLKVLLQKEQEYLDLGIPREVIRSCEKFFVYKTETIKERIELLDSFVDKLQASVIDKESANLAKQTIRNNKSLMIEFGKDRIKVNTDLVLKYAHDYNWNNVVEEASQLTNDALKAVLYNILKAKPTEFKKHMEQNPDEDVYQVARKLVNKNKSRSKK